MKIEISAGGIVVHKNKSVWEVLVLRDMNDAWTFPKGMVENKEELVLAAQREIQEEVGVTDTTLVTALPAIRYMYQRNGLISKVVHYFLFTSGAQEKLVPQKEEGIKEATWMPIDQAIEVIGYAKTNRPMLENVKKILE